MTALGTRRILFNKKHDLQENVENNIELLSRTIDPIVERLKNNDIEQSLAAAIKGYIENIKEFRDICNEEKIAEIAVFFQRAKNVAQLAKILAGEKEFLLASSLLQDDINNLRSEIDSILDSINSRRVNLAEEDSVKYSPVGNRGKIKTVEHRLDLAQADLEKLANETELVTGRAKSASKLVDQLSQEVGERLDGIVGGANARLSTISLEFDEKHKILEKNYDEKRDLLNSKIQDLDKLMQVAARKAMASGYMRNALKEEKIASNFRLAAIALMSITAYAVVLIVFVGNFAEMNPMLILQKSLALLFVTFIVAYLARQSAVHRAQQQKYMQTALDIGALKPFVATLPEDVKNEILKEFAQKLFNPKDVGQVAEPGFGVQELVLKLIDKMEFSVEKIKNSKSPQ